MATLAQLKARVASDLHRSSLDSQIASAIDDAIAFYERRRFYFLEGRATLSTINGTAYYAVPDDVRSFDTLLVTISGSKVPLRRVGYAEIDEEDMGLYTGYPTRWALYADQIRLYPVPNATFTLTLSFHLSLGAPAADSSSNAWTTDAFDLIRFRADWDMAKHHIKNLADAESYKGSEIEALASLGEINTLRATSGRIKKREIL